MLEDDGHPALVGETGLDVFCEVRCFRLAWKPRKRAPVPTLRSPAITDDERGDSEQPGPDHSGRQPLLPPPPGFEKDDRHQVLRGGPVRRSAEAEVVYRSGVPLEENPERIRITTLGTQPQLVVRRPHDRAGSSQQ